jgi:Domain of unknown function (DUF4145)
MGNNIGNMSSVEWRTTTIIDALRFVCGYCGCAVASERGWAAQPRGSTGRFVAFVHICPLCMKPTFFDPDGSQTPGVVFGNAVRDVPEKRISDLYDEARKATGAGSYTASVLCCRKVLMHIAVSKGAKAGESFVSYVEYLAVNNYIPPDARDWVDHIRKKSNEANHEILIMSEDDAQELISFIEMLLKVIFEFPAAIKRKTTPPSAV